MTLTLRRRDARAGVVAVEFAIMALAFAILFVGVFHLSFVLYAQVALDYAAKVAARSLQTGQLTITQSTTQSAFQVDTFCPALSPFMVCSDIIIVLQPVTNYQTAIQNPTLTATINPGINDSMMLLQAYYTPSFTLWPLPITRLVGTAAYRNDW